MISILSHIGGTPELLEFDLEHLETPTTDIGAYLVY